MARNSQGYTDKALQAVANLTYDTMTGRKIQYRSSKDQVKAGRVPALNGMGKTTKTVPVQKLSKTTPVSVKTGRPESENVNRLAAQLKENSRTTKKNLSERGYASSRDIPYLNRPSTKYKNDTAKEIKSAPTRDTKYDKDLAEFYEWRYNLADRTDYDPATDSNIPHWNHVKQEIMAKNKWSDKEFEDRWKAYDKEKTQESADKEVALAQKAGENSKVLGTLVNSMYFMQAALEGGGTEFSKAATLLGKMTGKENEHRAESADAPQLTATRARAAAKNAVLDQIDSNFKKSAYNTGTGLADMVMSMGMGGVAGPFAMAGVNAADTQMRALERGIDPEKAESLGAISGGISALANKVGLDAIKPLQSTGTNVIKNIGKAALREGLENVGEDALNLVADVALNSDKSELNALHDYYVSQGMSDDSAWGKVALDKGLDLTVSGLTGAAFGALVNGARNYNQLEAWAATKLGEKELDKSEEIQHVIKYGELPVDNDGMIDYNDVAKGDFANGERETLNGTGNQGSVRPEELNPVGAEIGGDVDTERTYTREDGRTFNLRDVVDENLSRQMDDAGIKNFGLRDTSGQTQEFSKQLADAKASNKNGRMVSSKTPEELQDAILFSDDARTCGVAIEPNGNIVAVHKNSSNTERGAVDDMLLTARANGGDRLDCYGIGLVNKYEMDGFVPVARVEWNEKFRPDDWGDNAPEEIYVMMKDPRSNEQVIDDIKNGRFIDGRENGSTQEELEALPYYTIAEYGDDAYDEALNYRDSLIDNPTEITEGNVNPVETNVPQMPILSGMEKNLSNFTPTDVNSDALSPVETAGENPPEMRVSNLYKNSYVNADIISKYEYENNPQIQEASKYAVSNNETSFQTALKNVRENGADFLNGYLEGSRNIDSENDVDTAMMLLQNLTDQVRNNPNADVQAQRDLLASRLQKAATQRGQFIQAFAKWNDTADGAINNGRTIMRPQVDSWKEHNVKASETNKRVADDLVRITNGGNYKAPQGWDENGTSATLDKALRKQGYDGTMDTTRAPKTHEQIRTEVENSIRREYGSVADQFTDQDFEYLTSLVENKVPIDTIVDELNHKLNHGEWYTIDESTPIKKQVSTRLSSIFAQMGDDGRKANAPKAEKPVKSHATIVEEVRNTLDDEMLSLGLGTDTDVEFMATMLEEGVPRWQIEDEIQHRLATGEWYTLDESIEQPKPLSKEIQGALSALVADENPRVEAEKPTIDQIREQVRNTLDTEYAGAFRGKNGNSVEFTDEDVNYLANLINEGATKAELADVLDRKFATGRFDISADTQNKVNLLFELANKYDPNSKEACEAKAAAYKLIADETIGDATALEKFDAWRYLAMLGNPKTMLRNFIGNKMFGAVTGVSNNIAAGLETVVDKATRTKLANKLGLNGIERTKAILNPSKDKGLIKASTLDGDEHRYKQLQGTKYEKMGTTDAIRKEKSAFNSKLVQLYEKATDAGISDYSAIKRKYGTSLAGYLKANGFDESVFDDDNTFRGLQEISRKRVLTDTERAQLESTREAHNTLEKARDYAIQQAEYATFHEDNAFAQWLTHASQNAPTPVRWWIEGMTPFKKTPANILRSGAEFSPIGIINDIYRTVKFAYENTGSRKGNLADTYTKVDRRGNVKTITKTKVADILDGWAKTFTGSMLVGLGYFLKNKGIINSSTDDEKYQDELEGKQNYSITIGGKTFTLDWAAPAVMPLLMGAELSKIKDANIGLDKHWYENMDEIMGTVNTLLDPVLETSMMQGVKNSLEAAANEVKYNENAALGGIIGATVTNALTGYASQALPTISGQIARVVDPVRRSTDTATESPFWQGAEKQMRKTMNKIPFLSKLNTPYVDAHGREQLNSPSANPLLSIPYQMLSPSYIDTIDTTDADQSARDVYHSIVEGKDGKSVELRDSKVFPQWKSKVTVDGHKFSPEEMYKYRTESGQASKEIRDALANAPWFNNLDGQTRANILDKIPNLVDKIGKEANGYPQDDRALDAYREGVPSLLDYYQKSAVKNQVQEQTGLSANSNALKDITADIIAGDMDSANQKIEEAVQKQEEVKPYEEQASELGVDATTLSQVANYAGDSWSKVEPELPKLKGMGVKNYSQYAHAVRYADANNDSVSTDWFANITKTLDTDNSGGVGQDELIDYFNKNNMGESEVMRLWGMLALGKDGAETKSVPHILTRGKNKGKWGR